MDLASANRFEYAYHVEADVLDVRVLRKVGFGQSPDRRLLARRYGFQWISILRAPAQLYLNEDQGLSRAQNEIYFAIPGPVVALDERVSLAGEVVERQPLAPVSGPLFAQTPTPA